jgi:hypothetical protein
MVSTAERSFGEQGYLTARNLILRDVIARRRAYLERSLEAADIEFQRIGTDINTPRAVGRIGAAKRGPNVAC